MSLSYPIAETGRDAIDNPRGYVRTKRDAERDFDLFVQLETEWLTMEADVANQPGGSVAKAAASGAAQIYAEPDGKTIVAITYWKPGSPPVPDRKPPKASDAAEPQDPPAGADHADDLYFRHGRTKKRRRKRIVDPNQFDLFPGTDASDTADNDPSV